MRREEIWGFKVVAYMFLSGLAAGAFGAAAALDILTNGQTRDLTNVSAWVGLLGVGAAVLFLTWDLGVPRRFYRLARYRATPILSVFMILAAITCAIGLFSWRVGAPTYSVLMGLVVVSAFAVATYVGFILAKIKCRPFWNTPMLPLLIVVSSVSWGIGALFVASFVLDLPSLPAGVRNSMASAELVALSLQLLMVAFYVVTMDGSSPEAKVSVHRLVLGDLSLVFWIGVVLVGMLLPLGMVAVATAVPPWLPAVLVLAGGFSLCHCLLSAGARSLLPGEPEGAAFVR